MKRLLPGVLGLMLAVGACGDSATAPTSATTSTSTSTAQPETSAPTSTTEPPPPLSTTTTTTGPSSEPTTSTSPPEPSEPVPLADIELNRARVASGFTQPVMVTFRPGNDALYVGDQDGEIWRIAPGEDPELWLDIREGVIFSGEQGLLGIAFHPGGDEVFVSYTATDGATTVDRWSIGADGSPTSRESVIAVEQPFANHNGGNIAFGPDGYLWIGLGDGGGAGDPIGAGQDPFTLLGAMARIDVDSARPYAIPPDNPFADGEGGAPEVYLIGLRNPWRFSFDGDDLWIGDVGQGRWEEVDLLPVGAAGANLGWPRFEGNQCFSGDCSDHGVEFPVYAYLHTGGRCSITGGHVYRGAAIPALEGAYLFGDYCSGEIFGVRVDAEGLYDERVWDPLRSPNLTSFGVDADGEIYMTTADGEVWRVVAGG